MRIAHVVPVYPPYRGGMGQVAFEYTERLRALGHDVEVFTPRYRAVADDPPYVHRLAAWPRVGNAALLPGLAWRVTGFDVVHLHYPFFGAELLGFGRPSARRPPLVLSYYMDATADGARGAFFETYRRLVLPGIVSRASRVLVSSRDYAEHSALARLPGVLDRVEVHPYGVDLERFRPGGDAGLGRALGIDARTVVILFVGGLDRAHDFKGLPVLFEALAALSDVPYRLIVLGDGPERERYQRLAASCGVGPHVLFAGAVSDDELPRYYRVADLHVLPSTTPAEAFGLVTIEAAASGVSSVVSGLPGVRTTVRDGETGLIAPPGDRAAFGVALRRLVLSRDTRERLGRQARVRAEREYAWEPLIRRLERTYREVSETPNARA